MLKYFFFGIGFVLIFEGLIYFFLANKMQAILEIFKNSNSDNIRFFSSILILLGLCLVYFTFKIYEI